MAALGGRRAALPREREPEKIRAGYRKKVNVNLTDFCPAIKAIQAHWGSEFTFFTEAQCVIIYV